MSDDKDQSDVVSKYGAGKVPDADGVEVHACFGLLRGVNASRAMVELRFKAGREVAFPYSYVYNVDLVDEGQLIITFVGHVATIEGKQLRDLYRALINQRLAYIAEKRKGKRPKDGEAVVEKILLDKRD